MAKLDALKEKISTARAGLMEKLDKIAFIRKIREKRAAAAPAAASAASPARPNGVSLGSIYREGGVGTRLQVIIFYVLAAAAIASTVHVGRKMYKRLGIGQEQKKLEKEYSSGLSEMNSKVVENANLISLGKFTANVHGGDDQVRMMTVDIWIRVSDPATAEFAQKNETILHDRIVDSMDVISRERVNPLTEEGKNVLKSRILESLNKTFPTGTAEDIFFQNFVVQ